MKKITIQINDDAYKRLLRLAALDNTEYGCYGAENATEKTLINGIIKFAINSEIDSGESYWGDYEEDYIVERDN